VIDKFVVLESKQLGKAFVRTQDAGGVGV